mgnify:CR=1 FL=1
MEYFKEKILKRWIIIPKQLELHYDQNGDLIGKSMVCEKCGQPATQWALFRGYCDQHWGKEAQMQFFKDIIGNVDEMKDEGG